MSAHFGSIFGFCTTMNSVPGSKSTSSSSGNAENLWMLLPPTLSMAKKVAEVMCRGAVHSDERGEPAGAAA